MRHLILYHTAHSLSNYFAQIFLVSSGFSACRRRGLPRPIAVPRPSPRDPLHPKFHLAFGIAESPQGDSLYASPAGPYFSMKKSNQKSLGEDPETPYASESSRPETLRIPGAGLDDAYKVFILIRSLLAAGSKIKCAAGTLRAYLRRRTDDAKASFVSSRSLAGRGSRGPPRVTFGSFSSQKRNPSPGRRANEYLL